MSAAAPDGSRYSLGVLFLVAAFFIVAGPIYWHGVQVRSDAIANAYENADLYQGIYPTYHYASARMHAGELPLWNSRQLCGTPFLADPRVGIFQPLNIVFWLLPTERAMAAHAFLTLFLMAAFFVLFARSFGLSYTAATIRAPWPMPSAARPPPPCPVPRRPTPWRGCLSYSGRRGSIGEFSSTATRSCWASAGQC